MAFSQISEQDRNQRRDVRHAGPRTILGPCQPWRSLPLARQPSSKDRKRRMIGLGTARVGRQYTDSPA